jgi:hypothetical protein
VARAAVRVGELQAGTLPPVCAKTGGAADGYTRLEVATAPGWTWILLLFGIFPFLIATFFSTVRVVGLVPMSDIARRRVGTFNWLCVGLLVGSLLVIVSGSAANIDLVLIGLAMLIASIVVMIVGRAFVLPSGEVSGEWVKLSFVHERFAREMDRFYGRGTGS